MADTWVERRATLAAYRAILASRVRAQATYRASFALDIVGSFVIGVVEFLEVWVILHTIGGLGELDAASVVLVFGLSNVAWSLADLTVGHLDTISDYVREGRLEMFYLRPLSLLGQLATSEVSLRRIGRLTVGLIALGYGLANAPLAWTWSAPVLLVLAVLSGTVIFASTYVIAAGVQFFVINGPEIANGITYAGSYASQQPTSILRRELRLVYGLIIPVSFVGYLPTLALTDIPSAWMPAWTAWLAPVAAAWIAGIAALVWRAGAGHYQSGGG